MTRLAAGIAAVLMAASSAYAADLGNGLPPTLSSPPQYNWSGCYLGGNGGLGAGHTQWQDPLPNGNIDAAGLGQSATTDMSGGIVGGQIGCDLQLGDWVAGIAGSFDGSDIAGTAMDEFNTSWALRSHLKWFGTVTGRLGYAVNNVLLYGKAGGVFANTEFDAINTSVVLGAPSPTLTGWTAGAGVEWAVSPNWSVFAEAGYYGFSNVSQTFNAAPASIAAPPVISVKPSFETAMIGINYRFGGN